MIRSHLLLIAAFAYSGAMLHAAERTPWVASRVHGSPEPPLPYKVERAFPKLTFKEPLGAVQIPGTERMVVVEHWGKMFSIPNDETCEKADLFADFHEFNGEVTESYGIAFHPRFCRRKTGSPMCFSSSIRRESRIGPMARGSCALK